MVEETRYVQEEGNAYASCSDHRLGFVAVQSRRVRGGVVFPRELIRAN